MNDSEAPISLPCGCFHHIERGILNLCPQHLEEEVELLNGTPTPIYRPEEGGGDA